MTMHPQSKDPRAIFRPRPRPLDYDVIDGDPLLQINVYEQITLICRRHASRWTQYPIEPSALAQILRGAPEASGLLPEHMLGLGRHAGVEYYVMYVPPAVRRLAMPQKTYKIPIPPLIWAGWGSEYRIWALGAEGRPSQPSAPLFKAPFPNCYSNGSICWGSSDARPAATAANLLGPLKLFLEESFFNLHVAEGKSLEFPNSVVAQWQKLGKQRAQQYPLGDLVPAGAQLAWVLAGACWGQPRGQL